MIYANDLECGYNVFRDESMHLQDYEWISIQHKKFWHIGLHIDIPMIQTIKMIGLHLEQLHANCVTNTFLHILNVYLMLFGEKEKNVLNFIEIYDSWFHENIES